VLWDIVVGIQNLLKEICISLIRIMRPEKLVLMFWVNKDYTLAHAKGVKKIEAKLMNRDKKIRVEHNQIFDDEEDSEEEKIDTTRNRSKSRNRKRSDSKRSNSNQNKRKRRSQSKKRDVLFEKKEESKQKPK
jgi:cation transport ATPase